MCVCVYSIYLSFTLMFKFFIYLEFLYINNVTIYVGV